MYGIKLAVETRRCVRLQRRLMRRGCDRKQQLFQWMQIESRIKRKNRRRKNIVRTNANDGRECVASLMNSFHIKRSTRMWHCTLCRLTNRLNGIRHGVEQHHGNYIKIVEEKRCVRERERENRFHKWHPVMAGLMDAIVANFRIDISNRIERRRKNKSTSHFCIQLPPAENIVIINSVVRRMATFIEFISLFF